MDNHDLFYGWKEFLLTTVLSVAFRWVLRASKDTTKEANTIIHRVDISNVGNVAEVGGNSLIQNKSWIQAYMICQWNQCKVWEKKKITVTFKKTVWR